MIYHLLQSNGVGVVREAGELSLESAGSSSSSDERHLSVAMTMVRMQHTLKAAVLWGVLVHLRYVM